MGALKLAGAGLLSYAVPRILIAAGVPLDSWIAAAGQLAGAAVSSGLAIWIATGLMGAFLLLASLWWPRVADALRLAHLVPLEEAGRWLYSNSDVMRRRSKEPEVIDGLYPSIAAYSVAVLEWAGAREVCAIYARPEEGLPLERVEPEKLEISSQTTAIGAKLPPLIDGRIPRSDMAKVRDWIDGDPSNL